MRNASGHNYRNSSVIVDLAMGQIPRSTEQLRNQISQTINILRNLDVHLPLKCIWSRYDTDI